MAEPVLTKADFVERYARGEFGNASPTWEDLFDWEAYWWGRDVERRLFHIRNRVAGGETWYNLSHEVLGYCWEKATRYYKESELYISEMAPTELTLLQGEVQRAPWGLYLYYSTVRKPMREALRERALSASGIIALSILRRFLCPRSYDWLEYLLEEYPGHVVEFSSYGVDWGTVPGFNTCFWECRKY